MKCPYCGWSVIDGKCIRCFAEVKDDKKTDKENKVEKTTEEKEK